MAVAFTRSFARGGMGVASMSRVPQGGLAVGFVL